MNQNQQTYQRLKQALSLGLRRQILMAVCENINLRDHYVASLDREIYPSLHYDSIETDNSSLFVSINLNLASPNFWHQIAQWFKQNQSNILPDQRIYFQIIGIEKLTKETPEIQRKFIKSLSYIKKYIHNLDFNLLLWVSRPWLNYIQNTVPEFWCWHTGIFEFEGEPTPVISAISKPELTSNSHDSYFVFNYQNESHFNLIQEPILPEKVTETISPIVDLDDDEYLFNLVNYDQSGNIIQDEELSEVAEEFNLVIPPNLSQELITEEDLEEVDAEALGENLISEEELQFNFQINLPENQTDKTDENNQLITINEGENSREIKIEKEWKNQSLSLNNLEDLETLETLNYPPEIIATASFQVAYQYRDRIAAGEVSKENLKIAIQAYQYGLKYLPEQDQNLPDLLNDLGNLYWMLSRQIEQTEEITNLLKIAIQSYQLALYKIHQLPLDLSQTYAMIQNNLGAVYSDLARYNDPEINLKYSIESYQEALKFRSKDEDQIKYGATQNNLGTAYWHLSQLTKSIHNLKNAIKAYQEALEQYNPEIDGHNWAMIQNNIGTAYWNLSNYEEPQKWLNYAINCYHQALKYRTPETAPAAYAATQNNLGTAYWHLAEQNQHDSQQWYNYLQQSITAYEIALYFVDLLSKNQPPIAINFEFLVTLNNLGLINYQIANNYCLNLSQLEKSHYLDLALISYVKVLEGEKINTDNYQTAFNAIIKTIKTKFEQEGMAGQTSALSKIPSKFLPEILPKL